MNHTPPPSALLLIASGCPHCPAVLKGLSELVKRGEIGALEVINIAHHPERASELGVRSVPWTRIGLFEFSGPLTPGELSSWAKRAADPDGISRYIEEQLKSGQLTQAEQLLKRHPDQLTALLPLFESSSTEITVRIGIGALLESFAHTPPLQALIPELGRLSTLDDQRIRADACHYLGLSGSPEARSHLEARLEDSDAEVAEIAAESLEQLDTIH